MSGGDVSPWAKTESADRGRMAATIVPTWGRSAPSTTITAKTMEASPRGPNQPMKAASGGARACRQATRDGRHPHDGQAEHGIEPDRPGQRAERGPEQHGPEDEEGDGVQGAAELLAR